MSLPIIDLAAPMAVKAAEIERACRDSGFFYVTGHSVPADLVRRLDAAAREFFALPEHTKAEIAMERGGKAWRGFFPVGAELTSGRPDRKEGVYFGTELDAHDPRVAAGLPLHGPNLFPAEPIGLRAAVLDHIDEVTRVGQAVLAGLALALGLDARWFVQHLTADPIVLFRIFRYPPTGPALATGDGWGVGEHTDYGLLTLLGQDGTPGLEVRGHDGWVAVDARTDRFVGNIGDMLERLTGGRYRSTPHRVRNTSSVERLSYPLFLDPGWDAVVERLPIVTRPDDDASAADRWDRTSVHGFTGTYGDYLLGKVAKVFPALAEGTEIDTGEPA